MKILWFPRLQFDKDKLHITTWREMCRELKQEWKHDVRIAIANKSSDNIFSIPIFVLKKKFLRLLTFWINGYVKFIYHYLMFKPDVIILDIFTFWFSMPFSILPNRKALIIIDNRTPFYNSIPYQSTWEDKIIKFYTVLCYKYCKYLLDGMTVITDYYKQYICREFGLEHSFIGVWGSGVNINIFSQEKSKVDNKPNFLKEKFALMYHGDIGYNRGLLELVDAMKLINRKEIVLVLIGDGNAKNKILHEIKAFNLEKKIYLLPVVPYSEVPTYITYCDCAIMAYPNIEYWNNNNPIKLLEYLAIGKTVICTDIWTFRKVGNNKKCIYYIKQNNVETIVNAINYCYKNKEYLDEWGKEGIEIVKENFTWHKQAENLLSFINKLR